jgi:propionaldehyde dehydrogenase
MAVDEVQVQKIVSEVLKNIQQKEYSSKIGRGIFHRMEEAVQAAKNSQKMMQKLPMDTREKIIQKIREKIFEFAEVMAKMGVEETEMGNIGDIKS